MSLTIPQLKSFPRWIKISKQYTDFIVAGLTATSTVYQPKANEVVLMTRMQPQTPFTGGLIASYTISLGQASAVDVLAASSVFTVPTNAFGSTPIIAASLATPAPIIATAISTVGNLSAATQGQVDIYLLVSILPS